MFSLTQSAGFVFAPLTSLFQSSAELVRQPSAHAPLRSASGASRMLACRISPSRLRAPVSRRIMSPSALSHTRRVSPRTHATRPTTPWAWAVAASESGSRTDLSTGFGRYVLRACDLFAACGLDRVCSARPPVKTTRPSHACALDSCTTERSCTPASDYSCDLRGPCSRDATGHSHAGDILAIDPWGSM